MYGDDVTMMDIFRETAAKEFLVRILDSSGMMMMEDLMVRDSWTVLCLKQQCARQCNINSVDQICLRRSKDEPPAFVVWIKVEGSAEDDATMMDIFGGTLAKERYITMYSVAGDVIYDGIEMDWVTVSRVKKLLAVRLGAAWTAVNVFARKEKCGSCCFDIVVNGEEHDKKGFNDENDEVDEPSLCIICMEGEREYYWSQCQHPGEGICLICENCKKSYLKTERALQRVDRFTSVLTMCILCRERGLLIRERETGKE